MVGRQLLILWAGRHQRSAWETLCADYRKRLEREITITDRMVKTRSAGEGTARRREEGQLLLSQLPDPCWTIAMDSNGRAMDSPKLAQHLRRLQDDWPHPIAFMIGSDLGLDQDVVKQARQRLSLGPMTFGHELARLMLYEQLYRAISLHQGIKYHR